MERLWAPWRVEYIKTGKPEGCIFCDKPAENQDQKNFILKRGDLAFVMLNAYPYNPGHLMVAPNRHVADIADLADDEILDVMALIRAGKQAVIDASGPHGFNIGINLGRTAGAGVVDHVHIHIVPRWDGDTNFMPVIAETKVLPEALAATYARLREALARRTDR